MGMCVCIAVFSVRLSWALSTRCRFRLRDRVLELRRELPVAAGRDGDELAVLQACHLPDLLNQMSVFSLDVVPPYVECPSDHRAAEASKRAPEAVLPVEHGHGRVALDRGEGGVPPSDRVAEESSSHLLEHLALAVDVEDDSVQNVQRADAFA